MWGELYGRKLTARLQLFDIGEDEEGNENDEAGLLDEDENEDEDEEEIAWE